MVGVVSMVLAMTTVNVAVPDVMGAFGIGQDKAQWMSSAYMATMTAGMLINAWITGVLGERRTFVGALFFFSVGALLGGMAPTEDALIFARILQGFSAGVAQPLVMATIFTVFPAERRGMAMGVFGLGVVFAPAIGPTLGGLMIEYFSWRYVFYISLPFCVIAAVLGPAVHADAGRCRTAIPPFDWLGFALLCTALFGLMTGIADGQREGWSSDAIVLRLVLGAFGAASPSSCGSSIRRARCSTCASSPTSSSPPPRMIAFIFGAGMMGSTYVMPVFVQTIIGFTPLLAGLMMMPAGHHARLHLPAGRADGRRHPGLDHDHRRPAAVLGRLRPDVHGRCRHDLLDPGRHGDGLAARARLHQSQPQRLLAEGRCRPTRCARAPASPTSCASSAAPSAST